MPELGELTTRSAACAVARARKTRDREAEKVARADLAEAKIAAYVERCLAEAPPLSDGQLSRLRELLRPGVIAAGKAASGR